jgi:hypothetical protein
VTPFAATLEAAVHGERQAWVLLVAVRRELEGGRGSG